MLATAKTLSVFEASTWAALSRRDVRWSTYYNARQLLDLDIEGDFAECGVFAGAQIAMMYRAMADSGKRRKIHLFDTFTGVPESGSVHDEDTAIFGEAACSIDYVKQYLESWGVESGVLVFHEGRVEDTLPKLTPFPISFLRIDCDLYGGVKAAFRYLYPSLVERGICVLDDYAFHGVRQAFVEYFGHDAEEPGPGTISPLTWQRR